jgi:hypothetical protein
VFFNFFDGLVNTFIVVGDGEVNIQRANINIELELTLSTPMLML